MVELGMQDEKRVRYIFLVGTEPNRVNSLDTFCQEIPGLIFVLNIHEKWSVIIRNIKFLTETFFSFLIFVMLLVSCSRRPDSDKAF